MAILSFPAGIRNPTSVQFGLAANTQSGGRSPFDGTEQTLALPGDRWVAEIRWARLPEAEWRIMQAFLANLRGRAGRFTWGPGAFMPRKGTRPGDGGLGPRIAAVSTGRVIRTKGWSTTPGSGFTFRRGDLFGYLDPAGRPMLHMATEDNGPAGDGTANFTISPSIRRSPAIDTPLILENPTAVWRLREDAVPLEYERGVFASLVLSIEEAIY